MKVAVGGRVVAVLDSDDKKVEIIGRGAYLGDAIPPSGQYKSMGLPSPKIMIDDTRDIVWGYECMWMCEQRFESRYLKEREVIVVGVEGMKARLSQ
jgi:hypothetical protein